MADSDSVTMNTLCKSDNGTFVTLDDYLPNTSALSEGEIAALTTSMRQLGVGSQGGAEALAKFHQFICAEWVPIPFGAAGRNQSCLKNCSGMVKWNAAQQRVTFFPSTLRRGGPANAQGSRCRGRCRWLL